MNNTQATSNEQILDKVRKLLALSQSSNENEAALAASKAQALMIEHRLSTSDLQSKTAACPVTESEGVDTKGKFDYMAWKGSLIYGVAKLNGCTSMRYPAEKNKITLIGRESERQVVEYLCSYLLREIERLAFADFAKQGMATKHRWTWVQSFGMGAVTTILRRMREDLEVMKNSDERVTALVLRSDVAISDFMAVAHPRTKTTRSSVKLNMKARINGGAAGSSIQWRTGVSTSNHQARLA